MALCDHAINFVKWQHSATGHDLLVLTSQPTAWPYHRHSSSPAASLAACPSTCRVQADHVNLQNPTWFSPTVSGWWLSTRHCLRSTSTTIVRRQYVLNSTHMHSSRRSFLRCRWTTSVEQSACWTSPPQPFYRTVLLCAKDAFVQLSRVPSDF